MKADFITASLELEFKAEKERESNPGFWPPFVEEDL